MDLSAQDEEYGYDDGRPPTDRILWGRVAVLGVVLLLAFVLGRCSAGASDDDGDEVTDLQEQVQTLLDENADLQASLDARSAGGATDTDDSDGADDTQGDEGDTDGEGDADADSGQDAEDADDAEDGRRYEVQEGDYLYGIAEEVYGDGSKYDLIVEANGLSQDEPLRPGQVLEIPPDE